MRRKLTKKQALQDFREYILPDVKAAYEQDGRVDVIARREAWNNWTDMLHKEGEITTRQVETWTNPF